MAFSDTLINIPVLGALSTGEVVVGGIAAVIILVGIYGLVARPMIHGYTIEP